MKYLLAFLSTWLHHFKFAFSLGILAPSGNRDGRNDSDPYNSCAGSAFKAVC